jgi:hypothetical protein
MEPSMKKLKEEVARDCPAERGGKCLGLDNGWV